jgi:hypothetical protein
MPMSRCTKFSLANGKEELSISWDMANGELEIQKNKLPGEEKEEKGKQSVCFRTSSLSAQDWIELSNSITEAFGKLFSGYNIEDFSENFIENHFGCSAEEIQQLLDDDDDDDDD